MNIKIITVPFDAENEGFRDDVLTKFLINKKVRSLQPQFFQQNGRAYWTVLVEYDPVLTPAETKPVQGELSDAQQALFQKLRAWRKEKADQGGMPVFILATNEQLSQIAIRQPVTMEALRQIQGFGKKKVDQHGQDLIGLVKSFSDKSAPLKPISQEENVMPAESEALDTGNTE